MNQAVFSTSPNGMVIVGENGLITHLNSVAEKIFACTNEDVKGKELPEFFQTIGIDGNQLLDKCTATTPFTDCKKATIGGAKTCFLDIYFTLDPAASKENRYLLFVNDVTSREKRESDLKRAYAIETTLKKILEICRTGEKLEDTLKHALQITLALPDIKALSRAVIMTTENNLSRLELKAHIGLDPEEISSFFQEEKDGFFSLENTPEQTELLCNFIAGNKSQYNAIIEGNNQTVVMVIALEEKISNTFANENLNSVADIVADTIERDKLKKDQSELISNLNESLSDLATQRSFADSILKSLNNGVLVIDSNNRITQTNPAAELLLLQIFEGTVIGKTLSEVFGSEIDTLHLDDDSAASQRISAVNLNNEEINLEFTPSPIESNEGDLKVVVFSDVTEQQKIGVKVDKLNRFGTIAEIASAIAQEIKNPLTGIKSMSQVLDSRLPSDDKNKEFIVRIIKQVDRLDLLLNEFFLYARPIIPNKQKVMLNDILREAWQMAEARGNKKGLSLHEYLSADLGMFHADPDQLQQVFVHLFLNAIEAISDNSYVKVISEFVKKPSEKYDISLFKGLDDDSSYLVVVISDSGCGIAKDMAAKIFDPFVTNKNNHSGLGLSLVWRILKEHESNIYFDSTKGKGTTFTLFLKVESGSKGQD
ncbi:MAG: PAS domain-containing protein [Proteobacteria bacterium]|nr:PAS domain-containing protein [Pseudomonadota bacterium]